MARLLASHRPQYWYGVSVAVGSPPSTPHCCNNSANSRATGSFSFSIVRICAVVEIVLPPASYGETPANPCC